MRAHKGVLSTNSVFFMELLYGGIRTVPRGALSSLVVESTCWSSQCGVRTCQIGMTERRWIARGSVWINLACEYWQLKSPQWPRLLKTMTDMLVKLQFLVGIEQTRRIYKILTEMTWWSHDTISWDTDAHKETSHQGSTTQLRADA